MIHKPHCSMLVVRQHIIVGMCGGEEMLTSSPGTPATENREGSGPIIPLKGTSPKDCPLSPTL